MFLSIASLEHKIKSFHKATHRLLYEILCLFCSKNNLILKCNQTGREITNFYWNVKPIGWNFTLIRCM